MIKKPFPGSDKAVDKGCTCPVLDNAHGHGAWGTFDKPDKEKVFWVNEGCPLHAKRNKAIKSNKNKS